MKKNTALLSSLLMFTLLSTHTLSFAEDAAVEIEQNTPQENNDNQETLKEEQTEAKTYVTPTPQISRIDALKTSLSLRRISHQIEILTANEETFLTLNNPSLTSSTQGCVIMLHSDNEHPDWPDAIAPLRNALPKYSWCTISIEVPDITKRATPVSTELITPNNNQPILELPNQEAVFRRIVATMNQARSQDIAQFSLLGYKTGATYALQFLAANPDSANALMLIDLESPLSTSDYNIAQQIRGIPQPILDYYVNNSTGSDQFALWRQQAANQRLEIRGDFIQLDAVPDRANGKDSKKLLIQRVRGFLKQNTSQITQRKPLPNIKKGLFYESP